MNHDLLRRALCHERASEAFRRAGGGDGDLRVLRLHVSMKRPPVIRYRCDRPGEDGQVFAELVEAPIQHAEEERIRLGKRRRRQLARDGKDDLLADAPSGLVFRPPGLDARIPGLRWLHHPGLLEAALIEHGIAGARIDGLRLILRAHRLGKRAVLQVDLADAGGSKRLFARLRATKGEAGRMAFELHETMAAGLERGSSITVPEPLAFLDEDGAALFTALRGAPMSFRDGVDRQAFAKAMAAVVELQALDEPALLTHGTIEECCLLEEAVGLFSRLKSELCRPAREALAKIDRELAALPLVENVTCHRDFHEDQLLIQAGWQGERIGILDFDTLCRADPMLDIGNLLAHVRLAELRQGRNAARLESLIEAALGARFDRHRLDVWRRAALLRLATVHGHATGEESLAARLIGEAAA